MSSGGLCEVLEADREAIVGLFVERVIAGAATADVPPGTPRSELVDHVPRFLEALRELVLAATRRVDEDASAAPARLSSAVAHGASRLRLGFDVQAVVREYGVLRDCILDVAERRGTALGVRELAALCRGIDEGTAEAVREHTARKHDALERAVRARDDVLAVVSHDLRTPLNAIVLAGHRIAASATPGTREHDACEALLRAADEMRRMILELLDASAVDAREVTVELLAVSPDALVDDAVTSFAPQAEALGVVLEKGACAAAPVRCDPARLRRVLANLLDNALRHTPRGGAVTVSAEARTDDVRFVVRDTGSGLAPEEIVRVFERFVRGATATRVGSGLGLYIARGFVEACGGKIGAEATRGAGATFWFTLPRA